MLRKKRILKYCSKRWKSMRMSLAVLSISNDQFSVHELRLDCKKINSVANLLNWTSGQENFPTKPLRQMVRDAGDTRLAELNLKTLLEHDHKNEALEQEQNVIIGNGYA